MYPPHRSCLSAACNGAGNVPGYKHLAALTVVDLSAVLDAAEGRPVLSGARESLSHTRTSSEWNKPRPGARFALLEPPDGPAKACSEAPLARPPFWRRGTNFPHTSNLFQLGSQP
jgi:hypothetical protein